LILPQKTNRIIIKDYCYLNIVPNPDEIQYLAGYSGIGESGVPAGSGILFYLKIPEAKLITRRSVVQSLCFLKNENK